MSIRTEWSRASEEAPEVISEWTDGYGQHLEEGGVGLALGVDSAYIIEADEVSEIRDFAARIQQACDRFEATR
ncbi:MAG: hypothetical protein L0H78_24260 [Humibacillus sp.]|nr:hypothetical protein [Humibacillus sp.]